LFGLVPMLVLVAASVNARKRRRAGQDWTSDQFSYLVVLALSLPSVPYDKRRHTRSTSSPCPATAKRPLTCPFLFFSVPFIFIYLLFLRPTFFSLFLFGRSISCALPG
jgi:hypothetical protein